MPLARDSSSQTSGKNKTQSDGNLLALGIIGASFVGTISLISPFIIMQFRSPLPYMATPRRKILAALEDILRRRSLESPATTSKIKNKTPLRYYDLGSGDGETILAAASAGWKATGIELNSTLWGLSSVRRFFSPRAIRSKSNIVWGDLWKQNLHDADAVMVFGVKPLMEPIAKKIENECKAGTYVLSYRFLVPLQSEELELSKGKKKGNGLNADLVYDEEEMRIYKLK